MIILWLILGAHASYGQETNLAYTRVAEGVLSNSSVKCFFKDSRGYVWFGTEDGLFRYDGSNAYRYINKPGDNHSITHNVINVINESSDKQLWIGTAQGLCLYDRELDRFINVDSIKGNNNYLNNRFITAIEFDARKRLWIGTHEGGINIYDPLKKQFEYIIDPSVGGALPSANFISSLVRIGDTIWCSTKSGLLLYDINNKYRLPLNTLSMFSSAQISAIVRENKGNSVLISLVGGEVFRVSAANEKPLIRLVATGENLPVSSNRILSIAVDRNANIFAGGESTGLNFIDKNTGEVSRIAEGINSQITINSVQSIYADQDGLIWVGTPSNGAFRIDNHLRKFPSNESLLSSAKLQNVEAKSFAEDNKGQVWIALHGIGLGIFVPSNNTLRRADDINRKINNKNVTSVIFDQDGDLWVGTAGRGVFKIDPETNVVINYAVFAPGFGNDQVYCLYEDHNGTIWAGTWGSGLFYFDKRAGKFIGATEYDQPNHIPNTAYITDMLEDSLGNFWVGTLYGLYELKRRSETTFSYRMHVPDNSESSIMGSQVFVLAEDRSKNLWIGTSEGLNLRRKSGDGFTSYRIEKGLTINSIRSLLIDQKGNIWIGGNNGLSKFEVGSETFITYTHEDGLKSNSFHRKSAWASSSGVFLFGSNAGFDIFHPDSIRTTATRATLVLSDLRINNTSVKPGPDSPLKQHISLASDLTLGYDQRSFVIDFVALDWELPGGYMYCYMLEGFDDEWNCMGSAQSATYTNIDPGTYTFRVKAANRDGVWINSPVNLSITIEQVFWKTWWAFSLYFSVMVFLIYFLVRIRIERITLKNDILFEKLKAEQEHNLNISKTNFFTNVAHEFRTPLSLILIPLESLMGTNEVPSSLRERIFTAHKNANRMNRLVDELLDFNKLEIGNLKLTVRYGELVHTLTEMSSAFNEMALKRKISFSVNAAKDSIAGWYDHDKLERIIFNVLSNAFKFTSDGGEIRVLLNSRHSITPEGILGEYLELVIVDNGIGILPEELPHIFEKFYQAKSASMISSPGTGIGLSFTKALVELHNGTITVESVPDQSTVFTISLPIHATAYSEDQKSKTSSEITREKTVIAFEEAPTDDEWSVDESGEKPKILVVEDNVELRKYLVSELRTEFSILEATNGEAGLAMAIDNSPDLIISDIMMPVKSGIELCHSIKSDLKTSHIPFILLTARVTVDDQIQGIQTGADVYISKPFNIRYLIAHVHQIIASRRKLYARFSQDVYLVPGKAASNELDQAFLQEAIDFVIRNLQDSQLSVDSISALFNMSRMQVYRKLKALTGKSVVEFIRMVRLKQAIKLMDEQRHTLSEIAFEVGFNSASYFTRCFKEEYGKTPSEYLEQR